MKLNVEWLKEFVTWPGSIDELCESLTMGGLEVDDRQACSLHLEQVITARILETTPHPNAEALVVCRVDAGRHGELDVVCGAPNARAGLSACLALPGATVAGGRPVQATQIRGVESQGMLCSARELGLGEEDDGLLELPDETVAGRALDSLVEVRDELLELNVTPNRGDCLSVLGVAREVAAYQGLPPITPRVPAVEPGADLRMPVHLAAGKNCTRYAGRIVRDIDARKKTPLWLRERLRRCGVRSINVVVDITNYVMLELGQPMHAFDHDKLTGAITVRQAASGEKLHLLDGSIPDLDASCTVIADDAGAVAIAGVMGGLATGVTSDTRTIFLESAWFDPVAVGRCARRLKLHTDAAHRFERGVDPVNQARAIERATALVLELCGGCAGPVIEASVDEDSVAAPAIPFNLEKANALLGTAIEDHAARAIFSSLGLGIEQVHSGWQLWPPPHRTDLRREIDLVEELARLYGYPKIPDTMPMAGSDCAAAEKPRERLDRACDQLVAMGYFEAVTYSFIARDAWSRFATEAISPLELANPISRDMAIMRSSLWPGLLAAVQHNQSRQLMSQRLFEIGMIFPWKSGELRQYNAVAGVVTGSVWPEQWGAAARPADFYDLKQDVINLLHCLGQDAPDFTASEHPGLHPGECATVSVRGKPLGILGLLHPKHAKDLNLQGKAFLFEISLENLATAEVPAFRPYSRFPSVRRDLAIVVRDTIAAAAVLDAVWKSGGSFLRDLQLFDVYRGQGIDSDKKSLALGLIFQAPSSTLTDIQVEAAVREIVIHVERELGGSLRV